MITTKLLFQTSGVRSMTFNPDGRTLLCGLHESLKVSHPSFVQCPECLFISLIVNYL